MVPSVTLPIERGRRQRAVLLGDTPIGLPLPGGPVANGAGRGEDLFAPFGKQRLANRRPSYGRIRRTRLGTSRRQP